MRQEVRYYRKYHSESYGNDGCLMVELDEELYCLRAIFINSEKEHTTNFIETDEFGLPEGKFDDSDDTFDKLNAKDFKQKWETILNKDNQAWEAIKLKLAKKKELIGVIKYFYPQGIIIDIGEKFLGVADYNECKQLLGSINLYPKTTLKVRVTSFDEQNRWIILSV